MDLNETQKGKLTHGIEFDGELHRDFEIRRELVGDAVAAYDNPRSEKNKMYATLMVYARRIVRLGGIPKDKITAELLMLMPEEEFAAITAAAARFRSGNNEGQAAA
jgi:hypothetical protein